MDEATVRLLANVLAVQAEIEGMKIENKIREIKDQSPAYNESDFQGRAFDLECLGNPNHK